MRCRLVCERDDCELMLNETVRSRGYEVLI
jgi:hypothetical protein